MSEARRGGNSGGTRGRGSGGDAPTAGQRFRSWADGVPVLGTALRLQERYGHLDGNGVATSVMVSILLSIVPLLLVAIAVIGFIAEDSTTLVPDLVERFSLTPQSTETLTGILETASRGAKASSIIGVLGLAWTALNVGGALQAVVHRTWQCTGQGLKDKGVSLVLLIGLVLILGVSGTATGLVGSFNGWLALAAMPVGVAVNVGAFLWMFWWSHPLKVSWRAYLPGAVLAGFGFEVLKVLATVLLPRMIASSSALYGSIGIAVAVFGFLLFFGKLLVYASTLNVVRYERVHGVRTVRAEIPNIVIPGSVHVTRGLAVVTKDALTV